LPPAGAAATLAGSVALQVLSFLSLLGAAAAVLLAARLIFVPTENRPAARALAAFLFCAALFVADNVCYNEAAFGRFPWFYAVANPFIVAIGPIFFLYCSAAIQPGFVWSWRKFLHFIPVSSGSRWMPPSTSCPPRRKSGSRPSTIPRRPGT
jgi:hypothetical protein